MDDWQRERDRELWRAAQYSHIYGQEYAQNYLMWARALPGTFSATQRDAQFGLLKAAQGEALNLTHWHEFLKCLIKAGCRRASMISSQTAVLYAYTMFLIGKQDFKVPNGDLRKVIARWYFMTALTSRYGSSPETEMAKDLNYLSTVTDAAGFVALLDGIIADAFTPDYWNITLPNALATSSPSSPTLHAYHAALHLLDAKVLFSTMKVADLFDPAIHAKKAALERHHLFPKGYLKTLGITEVRDVNQIANFALVEWADNIDISDDPPSVYFPPLANVWNPGEYAQMCGWHALPQGWESMNYSNFLDQRRKLIAAVIRDGFAKL